MSVGAAIQIVAWNRRSHRGIIFQSLFALANRLDVSENFKDTGLLSGDAFLKSSGGVARIVFMTVSRAIFETDRPKEKIRFQVVFIKN
jgi:hypothetical protein